MKFRKKPVVIEAYPYTGDYEEVMQWANNVSDGNGTFLTYSSSGLLVHTLEGAMKVPFGNWIICGIEGELYSCDPIIFNKTYESVEE